MADEIRGETKEKRRKEMHRSAEGGRKKKRWRGRETKGTREHTDIALVANQNLRERPPSNHRLAPKNDQEDPRMSKTIIPATITSSAATNCLDTAADRFVNKGKRVDQKRRVIGGRKRTERGGQREGRRGRRGCLGGGGRRRRLPPQAVTNPSGRACI